MVNDADGSRYPTRAVYDEVVEPERLVWTEAHTGMTTTSTFTDLGGSRTEVADPPGQRARACRGPPRPRLASSPRWTASPNTSRPVTRRPEDAGGHHEHRTMTEEPGHRRRDRGGAPGPGRDPRPACPPEAWDAPTLCAGWRVREVVAHITMPFRYSSAAVRVRDGQVAAGTSTGWPTAAPGGTRPPPPDELAAALRDNERNPWKPPGGGFEGALTHDVIHGLDITVAARHRPPGSRGPPADGPGRGHRARVAGSSSGPTWPGSNCAPRTWTGRSGRECRCPARPRTWRSSCAAARSRPGICAVSPVPGSPG